MRASDELFKLIQTMSPREKSYFKRYAGMYSNNNDRNYLRLFRAMDRQDSYDEKKLRNQLKNDRVLKHLSYEKGYLYKLLLKSIAAYNASDNLCALKNRSQLLLERGLDQSGNKLLEKALKKARKEESFSQWLELIQLKIDSISAEGLVNQSGRIEELMRERLDVMRKMANYDIYVHLRFLVFDLQAKGGLVKDPRHNEEYLYLKKHPMLENAQSALSFKARERFYYVRNLTLFIGREFNAWQKGHAEYVAYVEAHIELFDNQTLLSLYGNYLLACIKVLNKSEFNKTLDKMDSISAKFPGEASKNYCLRYARMLEYCSYSGDINRGEEILAETLEKYVDFEERITDQNKSLLLLCITRSLIESGRPAEALDWVKKYDQLSGIQSSNSMITNIKVMEIICHYELGSNRLVESHVRNLSRMLKKQNHRDHFLSLILSAMGKLSVISVDEERVKTLIQLRENLTKMSYKPEHNLSLEYFHYIKWVESGIEGISLRERILKSKPLSYSAN